MPAQPKLALTALACALGVALPAAAQDVRDIGQFEYMIACAVCHGESGKGMGPMAEVLNIETPSLTGLAAANDGVFPYLKTMQIIDGRTGLRAHGGPMPVWGERYSRTARAEFGRYGAEVVTRGRLAVLTDYIASIQE